MKIKPLPSCAVVRRVFDYDPRSGIVTRRVKQGIYPAGTVVGSLSKQSGYLVTPFGTNNFFQLHRIIWLWMMGREPTAFIDHEDLCRSNNRWDNLREATKSQNMANAGLRVDNVSGVRGVHWSESRRKWVAQARKDNKPVYIGRFSSIEEAAAAYARKTKELFGEFARAA